MLPAAFDEPSLLPPGACAGNYRVLSFIGRGSMGTVYEAEHRFIDRRAAIKVLAAELSGQPRFTRRFIDEANALGRLRHPGLVELFEFGILEDGLAFFAMELLEGETLAERLRREGPLPAPVAVEVARSVAAAIDAAHTCSIVHRDLKPDNVMLARLGEGERVKVLDFGVAKVPGDRNCRTATETGAALGTPHYMAPEQCIDAGRVGPAADVYALGIMLYEMLAGAVPFVAQAHFDVMALQVRKEPRPLAEAAPGTPPALCALVHAMVAKCAARRPTMAEVAAKLDAMATPDPAVGDAPSVEGNGLDAAPSGTRGRWTLSLAVAATILAPAIAWRTISIRRDRGAALAQVAPREPGAGKATRPAPVAVAVAAPVAVPPPARPASGPSTTQESPAPSTNPPRRDSRSHRPTAPAESGSGSFPGQQAAAASATNPGANPYEPIELEP